HTCHNIWIGHRRTMARRTTEKHSTMKMARATSSSRKGGGAVASGSGLVKKAKRAARPKRQERPLDHKVCLLALPHAALLAAPRGPRAPPGPGSEASPLVKHGMGGGLRQGRAKLLRAGSVAAAALLVYIHSPGVQ
ncbi:unnamed protein product, partial [Ectocarpus sp. 12 AP-2014]